jgi:nucleoside-diphosphate-sugar epimerase
VLDTVDGFIKIAKENNIAGEVINIGSNYEISIKDTVELIKKLMNSDIEIVIDQERIRPTNSEVERLWCDNTKINQLTGFTPQYSLEDGLKITIEWFLKNISKYKTNIYNI